MVKRLLLLSSFFVVACSTSLYGMEQGQDLVNLKTVPGLTEENKKAENGVFDELIGYLKKLNDPFDQKADLCPYSAFLRCCNEKGITLRAVLKEYIRRKKAVAIEALKREWNLNWEKVEEVVAEFAQQFRTLAPNLKNRVIIFDDTPHLSNDLMALIEDSFMRQEIYSCLYVIVDKDDSLNAAATRSIRMPFNGHGLLILSPDFETMPPNTQEYILLHEWTHIKEDHPLFGKVIYEQLPSDKKKWLEPYLFCSLNSWKQYRRAQELEADLASFLNIHLIDGAIQWFNFNIKNTKVVAKGGNHPSDKTRLKWAWRIGRLLLAEKELGKQV